MQPVHESRIGHFELVVVGATPCGIACAVRAAREGVRVLLVEASQHVGGMWTNGLQGFDTRYAGHRCPILSEFAARLQDHYIRAFGDGSPEHAMASFGDPKQHGERPRFEAWVAETVFRQMLEELPRIRLLVGHRLESVQSENGKIEALRFESTKLRGNVFGATGDFFVDATYEADLVAGTGAAYHVGREGRDQFDELHAGRHFTTIDPIGDSGRIAAKELGLHYFNRTSRKEFQGSTGEGDAAVQAFTLRLTLTDLPANRRPVKRPEGYDRRSFLGILDRSPEAHERDYPLSSSYLHGDIRRLYPKVTLPNRKTDWLGGNFVGRNHDYPEASPASRRKIYREHAAHALGTLYFLQTDPAVPLEVRREYGRWGLAGDEFVDNGHIPGSMYVREARRLRGLHVFTEHDATRHANHARTPIHADSVGFAEWPMDSHDCNPVRGEGSFNDGEFILADQTLPSQIPLRCMFSDSVENMVVPLCLSSTHVGWGTLRLEPVMMHMGEVAGVLAASCLRQNKRPRELDPGRLQWELLERHITISYFADLDLSRDSQFMRDVQFLSTRGFYGGYHAHRGRHFGHLEQTCWERILAGRLVYGAELNHLAGMAGRNGETHSAHGQEELSVDVDVRALLNRIGWGREGSADPEHAVHAMCTALRRGESLVAAP